tara:strand:+ start:766 stop:1953 length:1188 start_codon:yes stop_codon:yes gene_type:complete
MNNEMIAKIFVKESTQPLNEYNIPVISNSEAYSAFIEPFVDVFKVAKMALKDIGVGLLYNLRLLFTFDVTKRKRLIETYEQKMDIYSKEWDSTMNALGTTADEKMVMFLANPVGVVGLAAVKAGVGVGEFVNDTFREQRLGMQDGGIGPDSKPTGLPPGPLSGIANDLKRLFFGESYFRKNLLEQKLEDVESEVEDEMLKNGIDPKEIKSRFDDFVKMKEDHISIIENDGIPERMEALYLLMQSSNLEDLRKTTQLAKSREIDLGNFLGDFEKEMSEKRKEIQKKFSSDSTMTEPTKFMKSLMNIPSIKALGDKATEKDYIAALEDSLFHKLKKNLQEDGMRILKEIQADNQELAQFILSPFDSIQSLEELANSAPNARAIVEKIKNTVNKITPE